MFLLSIGIVLLWFVVILGQLRIFLPTYPWISGLPFWSKTYLVLLQNDAQLRPGGGVVSGIGTLRFVAGVPVKFSVSHGDTLRAGAPKELPSAVREPSESPYDKDSMFQNDNNSANFPSNAAHAIERYQRDHPQENISGVIAINLSFVRDVLGIIGEVNVNGETWTEQNFFPLLKHHANDIGRHDDRGRSSRTDILFSFAKSIIAKSLWPPHEYPLLFKTIRDGFTAKNIQIFFTNTQLQNRMRNLLWTGDLPLPDKRDFLAVVESNQDGMTSNHLVSRTVEYVVDLDRPANAVVLRPRATVRVRMAHHGKRNELLSHAYTGYLRVLVPPGSELVGGDEETRIAQELGYESFGKKIVVDPGEQHTVEFSYLLPPSVVMDGRYSLHLQKQSGALDPYDITVKTSGDTALLGPYWRTNANVATWRETLDRDRDVTLRIIPLRELLGTP